VKNSAHRNEFNFEYQKGVGINKYLSHVSANVVDLIGKMLIYDPDLRPTARDCLNHECFKEFVEQDLKNKLNQNNFYQDSSFMKSFNDSLSIKNDESIQIVNLNNLNNNNINNNYNNSKTLKTKKEASNSNLNNINTKYNYNNILLPVLKLNNINEDSKGEDSFNNSSIIKKNIDPYLKLPKIAEKNNNIFDAVNFMNSNEFKRLKHNISNHSIDKVMSSAFTIYEKKQKVNIKKRINEVKKNYISPYSKKIIENNLII
jgi:serine/threonine protein kinase